MIRDEVDPVRGKRKRGLFGIVVVNNDRIAVAEAADELPYRIFRLVRAEKPERNLHDFSCETSPIHWRVESSASTPANLTA
jgi:hypothetical protein